MKGLLIDILGMRILLVVNAAFEAALPHIEAPKNDLTVYLDFDGAELECRTEASVCQSAERILYALYVYLFFKSGFPDGEYDAIINGRKYTLCGDMKHNGQYMENVGKCNGIFTETIKIKGIDEISIKRVVLGRHSFEVYECHDARLVDVKTLGRGLLMRVSHTAPRVLLAVSYAIEGYSIRQIRYGEGEIMPEPCAVGALCALYGGDGIEITALGDFGRACARITPSGDILVYPERVNFLEVDF
ncbi:MAG: hypothetical protein IJY01_04255 [Clostridia bacterium]|nr:hypothetical protein [Clostridia bacterium]